MASGRLFKFVFVTASVFYLASLNFSQSDKMSKQEEANRDNKRFRVQGKLINFSEGEVECLCAGTPITSVRTGQRLMNGDAIQINRGRAEILLNPGSYLRLGDNTQIQLLDLSAGNLRIKLLRGSAIIEVVIDVSWQSPYDDWKERLFSVVTVTTALDEFAIARGGVYRFDVNGDGRSEVKVIKGMLAATGQVLEEGEAASFQGSKQDSSFSPRNTGDGFDNWSRDRALALVQSNKSLKNREWFKQMKNGQAYLDVRDPEAASESVKIHTISALGSTVNFAEAGSLITHGASNWQPLKSGTRLSDGDRVRTTADTRAEIQPYPNLYLFLGRNSEIAYAENAQGEVSISVAGGSLIVATPETDMAAAPSRNILRLSVAGVEYLIDRNGYYRANVSSEGAAEMIVRNGSVRTSKGEIQSPKKILSHSNGVVASSFDRSFRDSFDIWSDHRLARHEVPSPRAAFQRRFWFLGVWFLNELTNEYTFVAGGRIHKSPYSGEYSVIYNVNPPRNTPPGIKYDPVPTPLPSRPSPY